MLGQKYETIMPSGAVEDAPAELQLMLDMLWSDPVEATASLADAGGRGDRNTALAPLTHTNAGTYMAKLRGDASA